MTGETDDVGPVVAVATTLYVADLDRSVRWYAEVLGVEPLARDRDAFPYARYRIGGAYVVLEPASAATDPVDSDRTGGAALNLVVERDPGELASTLRARGVPTSDVVRSPAFDTVLVRDPDGHRLYLTRPRGPLAR